MHESLARLYALALEQFDVKGPTAVGNLIGESSQTVNNWGGRYGVSKLGAMKIQDKFGWSARWIRDGVGPRRITLEGSTAPALGPATMLPPRLVRRVPVIGELRDFKDAHAHLVMIHEFTGDHEAIAAYTGGVPARAFRVNTEEFFPRVRRGEYVVVATDAEPLPLQDVLVHPTVNAKKGSVYLYQFLHRIEDTFVFQYLTKHMQVTYQIDEIVLIEPVLGVYNKLAKVAAPKSKLSE